VVDAGAGVQVVGGAGRGTVNAQVVAAAAGVARADVDRGDATVSDRRRAGARQGIVGDRVGHPAHRDAALVVVVERGGPTLAVDGQQALDRVQGVRGAPDVDGSGRIADHLRGRPRGPDGDNADGNIARADGPARGVAILRVDARGRQAVDLPPRVAVALGVGRVATQRAQRHGTRRPVGRVVHVERGITRRVLDVQGATDALDALRVANVDGGLPVAHEVGRDPRGPHVDDTAAGAGLNGQAARVEVLVVDGGRGQAADLAPGVAVAL